MMEENWKCYLCEREFSPREHDQIQPHLIEHTLNTFRDDFVKALSIRSGQQQAIDLTGIVARLTIGVEPNITYSVVIDQVLVIYKEILQKLMNSGLYG